METRRIVPPEGEQPSTGSDVLSLGEVLAERYQIQDIIGVGGMSTVYRARDLHFPNIERLVAVKEMITHARDPLVRETVIHNFEREAHILASLRHPAIPQIYDYFAIGNRAYLVLEFIQGKDLEALLNETEGFFPEAQVLGWAIELCDVLHYLHSQRPNPVVFRDMKPSNVMITPSGRVMLIDFGIAKVFQSGQKGTMIGTEGYAPPEQYRGEATPLVDIYALGATLHHVLTRRDPRLEPPFSFESRPIRAINPAVSPEFEAVVMRALAYDPQDRFQSALEMKEALMAVARKTGALPRMFASTQALLQETRGKIKPIWAFKTEDEVRSTPLVYQGTVYIGSYDHNLYALNAETGEMRWKFPTEGGVVTQPITDGQQVYFGSEDRRVYALSLRTGTPVWSVVTGRSVRCSPSLAEGHVFIGSDDAHLYAINQVTGHVAWKFEASSAIRSRPFVAEGRVYFGSEEGDFYCLDFQGKMVWRFRAKRAVTSAPVVMQGVVYFGSVDGTVYALDAEGGWVLWRFRMGRGTISPPLYHEGRLYIGSADGHLYCLDVQRGREVWRFRTEHQVSGGAAMYEDRVYFGSVDGFLYCVEAETGRLVWKFATDGPITGSPVISGDKVFFGSHDHFVYAILV